MLIVWLRVMLLPIVLWWVAGIATADVARLLPTEQAFKFSAKWLTADRIEAHWDIADGYYLYRDKLGFDINGNATITSTVAFPTGISKQDTLFGDVQVLTGSVTTDMVVAADTATFDLIAIGQGCNEPVGVCYPPMRHKVQMRDMGNKNWLVGVVQPVTTPLQSSVASSAQSANSDNLRALLADEFQQPDFLDVDDAFKLRIHTTPQNEIRAAFVIADGYYLYRDSIKFGNNGENPLQRLTLPAGKIKKDPYFGEVIVFKNDFSFAIELSEQNERGDNLLIHASYQGCAEDGICYSPVNKSFNIATRVKAVAEASPTRSTSQRIEWVSATGSAKSAVASNQDVERATSSAALLTLLGAFFAGLLLTFTPCVLPMIPVLSSVIIGQGNNLTRSRGGILATAYVLGTVITYAGIGALAGATGEQLQAYFQNVWAIGGLSALFFIMALSMFGLFEIQMPAFIQSQVQAKTSNLRGSIPLVFLLGLVSALIIGACVSPILISFLGIAVSQGNPLLGAQLMTVMAVGMGLPLIALGLGAGYLMPRAGRWMKQIKLGFGLMLIAVAIYLLGSLPQVPILLLWGSFFVILGFLMDAFRKTPAHASNWLRLEQGIGSLLLIWGMLLIVGGFFGQRDMFKPLPLNLLSSLYSTISESGKFVVNPLEPSFSHPFIDVHNNDELEQQLNYARAHNKPLLIKYYADWCLDCERMEKTTFADSRVKAVLDDKFITVQIDVTDPHNADNKALKRRFGVFGPPVMLFIDGNGTLLKSLNFYGYLGSDAFLLLLNGV